jgi:predicted glycosyltransferase
MIPPRVLFYVQHLLGVGHLKRAALIAEGLAREGLDVTVAHGGRPFPEVAFPGVRVIQLPSATIDGEDFSTLLDADGRVVDDKWRSVRRDMLLDLRRTIDPDVVLVELFPFGRRQFAFELTPLLEAVHAQHDRARVACSVRDVLVASKKPGRDAGIISNLRRFFDAVLVHGDPALIPFGETFLAADEIADLIRYTGYVASSPATAGPTSAGAGEVIVSAGGGAVGASLLFAAAAARPLTSISERVWRFLTGPNLGGADFRRLIATVGEGAVVERFRADFPARLATAALSISQAGYNTTMDIVASRVRSIVVPYETKGETEQRLRAEILATKHLLTVVPEAELSPPRLATAIAQALQSEPVSAPIDLSGVATTARLVHGLAIERMR